MLDSLAALEKPGKKPLKAAWISKSPQYTIHYTRSHSAQYIQGERIPPPCEGHVIEIIGSGNVPK